MDNELNKLLVSKRSLQSMLKVNGYNCDEVEPDFKEMDLKEFKEYIEEKQFIGSLNDEMDEDGNAIPQNQNLVESRHDITSFFLRTGVVMSVSVKLSNLYTHKETGEKLFLFMFDGSGTEKLGSKITQKLIQICLPNNYKTGILFSRSKITTTASKDIDKKTFLDLRYFNANYFTDLTDYVYSPTIIKIYRNEESSKFFEQYGGRPQSLPKYAANDPISDFFLLKPGDLTYHYTEPCIPEMFNSKIPSLRYVLSKNYFQPTKKTTT